MNNISLLLSLVLLSSLLMADLSIRGSIEKMVSKKSAEELFKLKCQACHTAVKPTKISTLVAPPIMGTMRHVKMYYPDKARAVEFMRDYVLNPSRNKSLFNQRVIDRFGLMPSMRGVISYEELDILLPWLYDNFPPKGFRGRYRRN